MEQITRSGAAALAASLGAFSVDHLEQATAEDVTAIAETWRFVAGNHERRRGTVAVLLPGASLFLRETSRPPARALIDAGVPVALATDFNPGSAFCESLPLVCSLAATQLHLSPAEALGACTVNAAHVLGRAGSIGRLAPGYRADVVLVDAPDWRYLAYHLGGRVVAETIVGGRRELS